MSYFCNYKTLQTYFIPNILQNDILSCRNSTWQYMWLSLKHLELRLRHWTCQILYRKPKVCIIMSLPTGQLSEKNFRYEEIYHIFFRYIFSWMVCCTYYIILLATPHNSTRIWSRRLQVCKGKQLYQQPQHNLTS